MTRSRHCIQKQCGICSSLNPVGKQTRFLCTTWCRTRLKDIVMIWIFQNRTARKKDRVNIQRVVSWNANNFSRMWGRMSVDQYSGIQRKFWHKCSGGLVQTVYESTVFIPESTMGVETYNQFMWQNCHWQDYKIVDRWNWGISQQKSLEGSEIQI